MNFLTEDATCIVSAKKSPARCGGSDDDVDCLDFYSFPVISQNIWAEKQAEGRQVRFYST